jgi:hypothetical protein
VHQAVVEKPSFGKQALLLLVSRILWVNRRLIYNGNSKDQVNGIAQRFTAAGRLQWIK